MGADKGGATLILRVNTISEFLATATLVDQLKKAFQGDVVALARPGDEAEQLLRSDPRLSSIIWPRPGVGPAANLAAANAAARESGVERTVLVTSRSARTRSLKLYLRLFASPGHKYVMDLDHGIFGTVTFKGLHYGVTTAASYGHTHIKSLADIAASLFVRVMARPADSREVLDAARRSGAIKSILWVRTDGLGDVAMALPALHMLRENFPDAHITAVVRPISAPLMRMIKDVNQTVEFEPSVAPAATRMRSTDSFVTLARKLRATRFDLAVTMPIGVAGIVQSQMVALASGAPYLMDPSSGMPAGAGAVHAMKMHCPEVTKHASIETLFKCLEHAGLSRPAAEYRLDVPQSDREKMRAKLDSFGMPQKFAIVHARSAEREREWQAERFSAVADHLIATHGLHVAATGTRRDKEVVERIVAGCRYPGKLVSLCGKISVEELPALYSQATLMVSVDTGPMHVASMVGTPIVALFLPYYRYNSPYLQANHVVGPTVDDIVSYVASGQLPASGALLDYVTVADVTNMIDNVMAESAEPA